MVASSCWGLEECALLSTTRAKPETKRKTKHPTVDICADPRLLPSRLPDDIRSERGGCSPVLGVSAEPIISQQRERL